MNREDALACLVSLPAVSRIMVADLKPDDVIVMECDGPLPMEQAKRIKEMSEELWPGRKVVVLADGLRIKIVEESKVPT